jgi:hypothetical protein
MLFFFLFFSFDFAFAFVWLLCIMWYGSNVYMLHA